MRLECRTRGGIIRLQTGRSSSIDSNDEDIRIRLDDPSLRLTLNDSPSPPQSADHLVEHHPQHFSNQHQIYADAHTITSTSPNCKSKIMDLDPNMNTHRPSLNSAHLDQSAPSHV